MLLGTGLRILRLKALLRLHYNYRGLRRLQRKKKKTALISRDLYTLLEGVVFGGLGFRVLSFGFILCWGEALLNRLAEACMGFQLIRATTSRYCLLAWPG